MNVFVVLMTTCLVYLAHRYVIRVFVEHYIYGWFGWDIEEWTYYGKVKFST